MDLCTCVNEYHRDGEGCACVSEYYKDGEGILFIITQKARVTERK